MHDLSVPCGFRPRHVAAVLFVPLVLAVLLAGVCQSISQDQIVWSAGGPVNLLLELSRLSYTVTAAIFGIHGVLDHIQGRMTSLRWLPGAMDDLDGDGPTVPEAAAWRFFPNHLDCAVLAGGLAFGTSLMLSCLA